MNAVPFRAKGLIFDVPFDTIQRSHLELFDLSFPYDNTEEMQCIAMNLLAPILGMRIHVDPSQPRFAPVVEATSHSPNVRYLGNVGRRARGGALKPRERLEMRPSDQARLDEQQFSYRPATYSQVEYVKQLLYWLCPHLDVAEPTEEALRRVAGDLLGGVYESVSDIEWPSANPTQPKGAVMTDGETPAAPGPETTTETEAERDARLEEERIEQQLADAKTRRQQVSEDAQREREAAQAAEAQAERERLEAERVSTEAQTRQAAAAEQARQQAGRQSATPPAPGRPDEVTDALVATLGFLRDRDKVGLVKRNKRLEALLISQDPTLYKDVVTSLRDGALEVYLFFDGLVASVEADSSSSQVAPATVPAAAAPAAATQAPAGPVVVEPVAAPAMPPQAEPSGSSPQGGDQTSGSLIPGLEHATRAVKKKLSGRQGKKLDEAKKLAESLKQGGKSKIEVMKALEESSHSLSVRREALAAAFAEEATV